MNQPLAILLYERLFPGSRVVNRLQDLHYRVHALSEPATVVAACEELTPIVLIADLDTKPEATLQAIAALRANPATQHLPVVGFCSENSPNFPVASKAKNLTVFTTDTAVVAHLRHILDQALHLE